MIETERLLLRRLTDADREPSPAGTPTRPSREHLAGVQTRAQSDEAFDRWERHWGEHGFGLLAVEWQETGELIGRVGPQFHRLWPHDPEVGWALDPAWWGRGIATEAGARKRRLGLRRARLCAARLDHDRSEHRIAAT